MLVRGNKLSILFLNRLFRNRKDLQEFCNFQYLIEQNEQSLQRADRCTMSDVELVPLGVSSSQNIEDDDER